MLFEGTYSLWDEDFGEQLGEGGGYVGLRGGKEQGTSDSYINYIQFVC